MKRLATLLAAAMLASIAGCQVKPDSGLLNSAELQHLFSNKTVESYNLINGSTSFTYYAEDGHVIQHRYWEKRVGRWSIADDKICLSMSGKKESCRTMQYEGGKYYKYRESSQGEQEKIIRYRQFLVGNQL
ncbi:hypothetical protein [Amphritea balenae]|uniref:DUF995 domain-containing protein n=1 Tax=Amphritea balenae TaxID=452629 RepID=A0A3P1SQZ9_9GAMM|nr:hypothetical protein [Amphritea balenae]RRC99583.1 hypothetical protein EHS89_08750 [Amphritea balenae]GGK78256.1 hypothetical protein GCM10007941_30430 [Amphritea balenae]